MGPGGFVSAWVMKVILLGEHVRLATTELSGVLTQRRR